MRRSDTLGHPEGPLKKSRERPFEEGFCARLDDDRRTSFVSHLRARVTVRTLEVVGEHFD